MPNDAKMLEVMGTARIANPGSKSDMCPDRPVEAVNLVGKDTR